MNIVRKDHSERRTDAGFTLIELLIVMSIILILITLAIPSYEKIHKKGNETSAITSVRMLNSMEGEYNSTFPAHGYTCSLASLGGKPGSGSPSAEAAQLIPDDLAAGNKSGYTFAIANCGKTSVNNQDQYNSYEITAVPTSPGKSGDRGFCMSSGDDQIRYDPKGGTNCTETLQ